MKANIDRKQTGNSKKQNVETEKDTKAVSCIVSSVIAEKMKPFTEREFTKECMMSVVREVCPETKGAFENIGFSAGTMTRRTEELSEDFKEKF